MTLLTCFKAYDIRGQLGTELTEEIAYRIGRATAQLQNAKTVAVGFDARATSPSLANAVAKSICDAGAELVPASFIRCRTFDGSKCTRTSSPTRHHRVSFRDSQGGRKLRKTPC